MSRTPRMEAEDVTCPICLSLLLEPVTLPCHHSLCLHCFHEHVSLTSLYCPLCRTRIGVWVRKNSKTNTLVNVKLWKAIQKHFPAHLEARLAGREDSLGISQEVRQRVCEPGEIRQEYESFLEQQTQEETQRKDKEETASIKLIQQLQEEESKRQQEVEQREGNLAQEDFLLALQLEETDKAQMDLRQKKLQELCARDEDLARRLEVVDGRSPLAASQGQAAGGSRAVSASPRGPMDQFLDQRGVTRGHQPAASVLSSSGTNTRLSQDASPPPNRREPAIKLTPSLGSESESDEPPSYRHPQSAPGKENLQGGWQGSPGQQGEGSKGGRRQGHTSAYRELQLSPDIDSYWDTPEPGDHNGGYLPEDLLLKWDKDKESLVALLSEQQRAEAQLQQELHDRLLAEALQEEFNNQTRKVLRTKGSGDEYGLRRRKKTSPKSPHQSQAGPSRGGNTKRQATLSEVLGQKRHKSA
ncbi:E3 ubiquitin-protein ligase rnf168 [Chionoecetes opilio]|uniref:RING-type E3 ubiquitin transferase n=1 Tax=Chionoecetes opilio TaxID=41210 RepID=A0A8J4XZW6_CHIOP|nr:E3 ubiquitin-protein ligase rnf168 [Chionoecetes opilio]